MKWSTKTEFLLTILGNDFEIRRENFYLGFYLGFHKYRM
jgi:hypothetical protein